MRFAIAMLLLLATFGCAPRTTVEATPTAPTSQGATARTNPPTATPEATIRKKIGTAVAYEDGFKITVLKFEEQAPGRFSTPAPGARYVKLTVRYDNGTAKEISYNALSWKLQDSNGVRKTMGFILVDNPDALNSGKLAPGGFVAGSIIFELPVAEKNAMAIFEDFGYRQATWELF